MSYVGNLRQFQLGDILRLIGDGLRRGRLVVERGGLRADLYFENGYLLHVWRSGPNLSLAQRLVGSNLLSPGMITQIGSVAGADPNALADTQLAQIAVESGMLTNEQVADWVLQDAVDLLSILFSWRDGDYRFEDGLTPPPNRLRVMMPIPNVLGITIQRIGPWQAAQTPVQVTLGDILDFAEMDPSDPQPVHLSREQWKLLTLVDGETPLGILAEKLAVSQGAPSDDPQRFYTELRRTEDLVTRLASELIGEGVAVVAGHVDDAADGPWQGSLG